MSINKVALIGAGGNLGPAVRKALLDNGFELTILSREGSASLDNLESHPNQKIIKVNFNDVDSLTAALQGIEGVVCCLAANALLTQKTIIDAAVRAGVTRFLPSEFGSDMFVDINKTVPFNKPKHEIHEYLAETVKSHPSFSYSSVTNGPFLDWCLKFGVFADLKNHDITLWDGGDTKVSATTLPTVGKAVVGVFHNLEATENRTVRVADTTITQKEIMAIVKEIDGQEWTTKEASTAEAYQEALEELKKPQPNFHVAVMNQLYRIVFSAEHEPNMEDKLDNDHVGVRGMTEAEVKEVVKANMP